VDWDAAGAAAGMVSDQGLVLLSIVDIHQRLHKQNNK
jgi:hypothetical protein